MDFLVSEQDKVKLIKQLLDNYECVLVFLNTSNKDLVLPNYLKNSYTVTLQISLHFQGNMFLTDDGIKVDLIFEEDYESCFLPWGAIWGAKGEDDVNTNLWLDSMPYEKKEKILELVKNGEPESEEVNDNVSLDEDKDSKTLSIKVKSEKVSKEKNTDEQNQKSVVTKKATKYPNFTVIK